MLNVNEKRIQKERVINIMIYNRDKLKYESLENIRMFLAKNHNINITNNTISRYKKELNYPDKDVVTEINRNRKNELKNERIQKLINKVNDIFLSFFYTKDKSLNILKGILIKLNKQGYIITMDKKPFQIIKCDENKSIIKYQRDNINFILLNLLTTYNIIDNNFYNEKNTECKGKKCTL